MSTPAKVVLGLAVTAGVVYGLFYVIVVGSLSSLRGRAL